MPFRTEILAFDSWIVTCREFHEPKKRICAAVLTLTQSKTHQAVLSWTIGTDETNKPIILLQTPTGVILGPGVELRLGKAAARKIPYRTCDNGRCTATLPVDGALVRDMMGTANAEIAIEAINGQKLQFTIPMKGFDKAYAALQ
jgi:invasion protein IalB